MAPARRTSWIMEDLRADLDLFEQVVLAPELRPNTVETYVQRSEVFLRWLDGNYTPSGPVA